jgi:hypothetical protein
MGDIAEGIKSFKKGISDSESDKPNAASAKPIEQESSSKSEKIKTRSFSFGRVSIKQASLFLLVGTIKLLSH